MKLLVKAVVTGFGLSLGGAIFKKIQERIGLAEKEKKESDADTVAARDGATDPELQLQN
ncbi:MAG: hypothetical protein KF773_07325 [Deltaproteobacteria bacterium]|nr:hypothetical protein [Deltaproteobacteria bacterium]MCW5804622.1 hypothetical protein [Deltaproteobacteria bacterium]